MNAISNQIANSTVAKWFNALSSREKKLVSWTGVALVALFLLGFALPSTLDYRHSNVVKAESLVRGPKLDESVRVHCSFF